MKKPSNPPTIYNSEDGHVTLVLPKIDAFAIVNQYMLPQSQYVLMEKPSNPPTIYNSEDGHVTLVLPKIDACCYSESVYVTTISICFDGKTIQPSDHL